MWGNEKDNAQDGQLPLVLLPGTLCDARIFDPLVHLLPRVRTQVIGFVHARSMRQAAEQVLSQAPARFALLGFSLGGMVAMEVVSLAPERVGGLVLLSTTPLPVPPERHAARRAAVDEAATMPIGHFARLRLWRDYCGEDASTAKDEASLKLIESMAESLGCAVFSCQTELALQRPDYRPKLSAIRCSTLVVAGTQDRLCPPEAQQDFAVALPNCIFHGIPEAGHLALLQRPDEVASAVAAWFHTVQREQTTFRSDATAARQERK